MSITDIQKNLLYDSNPENPLFMRFSDSDGKTIYLYGFRDPRAIWSYSFVEENAGAALPFGKQIKGERPTGMRFRYDDKPDFTNITGVYKTTIPKNEDHYLETFYSKMYTANYILSRQLMIKYKSHFLGIPRRKSKTITGQAVKVVCGDPAKRFIVIKTENKKGKYKFKKIRERTLFNNHKITDLQRLKN